MRQPRITASKPLTQNFQGALFSSLLGEVKILLLVGADGRALNREVLHYVSEPLELSGHLLRAGSTLTLKAAPAQFRRISE